MKKRNYYFIGIIRNTLISRHLQTLRKLNPRTEDHSSHNSLSSDQRETLFTRFSGVCTIFDCDQPVFYGFTDYENVIP